MIAYHGKPEIKECILAKLEAHKKADEFVKGQYWEDGKGCAVGCTIESSDHKLYEKRFGIPIILARLEDRIFEGLENSLAKEWPIKFMSSINVGADLSVVWDFIALWILEDEKFGVINLVDEKEVVRRIASLYKRKIKGDIITEKQWRTVADAAAVAVATADAVPYAAYAAAATADAYSDAYADAYSDAYADAAAYSDAAVAAADAYAYAAAYSASKRDFYKALSEKMIEVLKNIN